MTEEMTETQAEEFIAKYGSLDEEQLINELGIRMLENNPDAMKKIMGAEGRDLDVEGLLEFMKAQREEGT